MIREDDYIPADDVKGKSSRPLDKKTEMYLSYSCFEHKSWQV